GRPASCRRVDPRARRLECACDPRSLISQSAGVEKGSRTPFVVPPPPSTSRDRHLTLRIKRADKHRSHNSAGLVARQNGVRSGGGLGTAYRFGVLSFRPTNVTGPRSAIV